MGFLDPGILSPEWASLSTALARQTPTQPGVVDDKGVFADTEGDAVALLTGVVQTGFLPRNDVHPLLLAYSEVPNLRQVVGRISEAVASVPWRMFATTTRPVGRSIARELNNWRCHTKDDFERRSERVKAALETGDLREVEDHPALALLLERPNPDLTSLTMRSLMQTSLDLVGETFVWGPRDGGPVPRALWPIPAHWVRSTPSVDDPFFEISYRSFHERVPEDEMIWMRHPDPANPYGRGSGIGRSLADELDGDEYAAKHISAFFRNGATPDSVVMIPDADDYQVKQIRLDWEVQNRGVHRARRTHFLNAKADIEQLQASFRDMDAVELRRFFAWKVRTTYGVPPEVFGIIDNSNRATITQAMIILGALVVLPRLRYMKAELDARYLPMFPDAERLVLLPDDPVPDDPEQRLNAMKENPATASVDEWRDLQGLDPIGEARGGGLHSVDVRTALVPLDPAGVMLAASSASPDEERRAVMRARTKEPTESDVEEIVAQLSATPLTNHVEPAIENVIANFGAGALVELGRSGFNDLSPSVVDFITDTSSTRLRGMINETTRKDLRAALADGVRASEGIPELSARVRGVFSSASKHRATTIARTEVLRAGNFGRWEGMRQSGLVAMRRWITAGDARVRRPPRDDADHVVMNNRTAPIDRPFVMPAGAPFAGRTAMFPGGWGIAALDVNCRCVTIPVMPAGRDVRNVFTADATDDEVKAIGDALGRLLDRWESKLEDAVRVAFGEQRRRMLAILREVLSA